MKHIVAISGGKDSVAMCDMLLKNGYPVDYIIFNNTMHEIPMMYEYIRKIKTYFADRYNKEIITTAPLTTFEEWCYGVIRDENSDYYGYVRGLPLVWSDPCYWRRESKIKPFDKWIKEQDLHEKKQVKRKGKVVTPYRPKQYRVYIGYTLDETNRIMQGEEFLYPLINNFKMSERNCQEYLINQEMENPLYKFFTRTGCGFCAGQSEASWFNIWKHFKEVWKYMEKIESELHLLEKRGYRVKNKFWFSEYKTCADMEKKFIKAELQGTMFDFSDEPLKDCFCKI